MIYDSSCFPVSEQAKKHRSTLMGDIPFCLIHIKLLLMLATNARCHLLIGANDPPMPHGSKVKSPSRLGGTVRQAVWPCGVTATTMSKHKKPKLGFFCLLLKWTSIDSEMASVSDSPAPTEFCVASAYWTKCAWQLQRISAGHWGVQCHLSTGGQAA